MDVPINYLAILVAAIASMVLGFLWFGPLFGKQWMALMGWTPESMKSSMEKMKERNLTMNRLYAIQAIGSLLMSYILAHNIVFAASWFGGEPMLQVGLTTGFFNWLGFIAPVTIGVVLWDGKPWKLWILQSGYWLVNLLIMGVILALWA